MPYTTIHKRINESQFVSWDHLWLWRGGVVSHSQPFSQKTALGYLKTYDAKME